MSMLPTSRLHTAPLRAHDARTLERSVPLERSTTDQASHQACLETIRGLREENAILRQSADQFAALAERLQLALGRERAARGAAGGMRLGPEDAAGISKQIEAEYSAIPNLRLTRWQAARLWNLDQAVCDAAITALVQRRVLRETPGGFVRSEPEGTRTLRHGV